MTTVDLTPDEQRVVDVVKEQLTPLIERIRTEAYRAGREDAARAVERFGEQLACHECGPDVQGFAAAARGDQPRTVSRGDGEDNPEERRG